MTPAIQFRNVTVEFGRHGFGRRTFRALDGLTLSVAAGDFLAIIGPNGSGKTTAIRCALGLRQPTAGTVEVFGQRLRPGTPANRDLVYVPEEPIYHDYMTVEEVTRYYAGLHGRPATAAALDDVFARLHLTSSRHTRLSACSKGMKQKVGLAQCLLQRPRLLVLDEPMRGLDPVAVREFRNVLAALHNDGVTVLMSSHVLPEVAQLATRVAILDSGRLLSVGDLGSLIAVDHDTYQVEVQGLRERPEYLAVTSTAGGIVRGTVPQAHLDAFLALVRAQGATIRVCSLRTRSLEDSLMATLEQARP